MRRSVSIAVGFAVSALLFTALVVSFQSGESRPIELFDSEAPDYFETDSAYSASPHRDASARALYADDDSDDNSALSSPPSSGSTDASLSSVPRAQILAVIPKSKRQIASEYRGSLAGRRRMAQSSDAFPPVKSYPTSLQERWESESLSQAEDGQRARQSPMLKEAAELRRRWLNSERQQEEDRRIYKNHRYLYEVPDQPYSLFEGPLAHPTPKTVAKVPAATVAEISENKSPAEPRSVHVDINIHNSPVREIETAPTVAAAPKRTVVKVEKKTSSIQLQDSDPSHIAAMEAIDSAFEEHAAVDEKVSMARHKAVEMLRHKAAKLKEISHEEHQKAFDLRHNVRRALRDAAEAKREARHFEKRAESAKTHQRSAREDPQSSSTASFTASSHPLASATQARNALLRDEKKEDSDELQFADESVNAQSLLAKHKGLSAAVNAKIDSLRTQVQKDTQQVAKDQEAMDAVAAPMERDAYGGDLQQQSQPKIQLSGDQASAAQMDLKAKRLRKHAKLLREQSKKSSYAQKTILEAADCLDMEADNLNESAGDTGSNPRSIYSDSLKSCGLL